MLRSTLYLPSFLLYKVFSVSFWCISAAFYSAADGTRSFYFLLQLQHYRDGPYYLIHSANILICSSITSAKVFWNKLRLMVMNIFYRQWMILCTYFIKIIIWGAWNKTLDFYKFLFLYYHFPVNEWWVSHLPVYVYMHV